METATIIPKVSREREFKWMEQNRDYIESNLKGKWIVVEGEELVAASSDFSALLREVKEKGVTIPFIIYVPEGIEGPTINI